MGQLTIIQTIAVVILPIIFAVTLHEAAHGFVAYKLGDDTAYRLGRVSANPLKHIDPIGTIILPIILMLTAPFVFGWAKPVPVNQQKLRHPKRDFALVALAGPASNFLMAIFWIILLKICLLAPKSEFLLPLQLMSRAGLLINIALMVLNLIPIPPLDGSRFISYLLPAPWDKRFDKITPFGILIILILIVTGILSNIMLPAMYYVKNALEMLFHIT